MLKLEMNKGNLVLTYICAIGCILIGVADPSRRFLLILGVVGLVSAIAVTLKKQSNGEFDEEGFTDEDGELIQWDDIHDIKINMSGWGRNQKTWTVIEYGDGHTKLVDFTDTMNVKQFVKKVNEIAGRDVVSTEDYENEMSKRRRKSLIVIGIVFAVMAIIVIAFR